MYRPPAFREDRFDVLCDAIKAYPLGTLITAGDSGLIANVAPFTLDVSSGIRVLRAHLAKANEQIRDLREGTQALVMFQGPQAYVSPSWYPTKLEHGEVVPTWNYIVVQAKGVPKIQDDPQWVRDQIVNLTEIHEGGRLDPWAISDAPDAFIAAQLKGIVGLEILIDCVEGKWKMSQNQSAVNRLGVVDGLRREGRAAVAAIMSSTTSSS